MRAMKGTRLNRPPPPPEEQDFSFAGEDWIKSDDGWDIPVPTEENENIPQEYQTYADHTSKTQEK